MEKKLRVVVLKYDHKQKLGTFKKVSAKSIIFKTDLESINIINSLSKDQTTKLFINFN